MKAMVYWSWQASHEQLAMDESYGIYGMLVMNSLHVDHGHVVVVTNIIALQRLRPY
jgi:hypothetical protein